MIKKQRLLDRKLRSKLSAHGGRSQKALNRMIREGKSILDHPIVVQQVMLYLEMTPIPKYTKPKYIKTNFSFYPEHAFYPEQKIEFRYHNKIDKIDKIFNGMIVDSQIPFTKIGKIDLHFSKEQLDQLKSFIQQDKEIPCTSKTNL